MRGYNRRVTEYILTLVADARKDEKNGLLLVRDLNSMLVRTHQWYDKESNRILSKDEEKAGVKKLPKLNFELVFSDEQESAIVYGKPVELFDEYKKVIGVK